jgi:hypothetical protein
MPTNHFRFSNINILVGYYRLPLTRFAIALTKRLCDRIKQFKVFCFGYIWSAGNAHPTFLFFTGDYPHEF